MTPTAEQDRIRCDEQWRDYCRDRMDGARAYALAKINSGKPVIYSLSIPHELSEELIEACALAGRTCKYEHEAWSVWGGLTILSCFLSKQARWWSGRRRINPRAIAAVQGWKSAGLF